jgi:hypothetical protein
MKLSAERPTRFRFFSVTVLRLGRLLEGWEEGIVVVEVVIRRVVERPRECPRSLALLYSAITAPRFRLVTLVPGSYT